MVTCITQLWRGGAKNKEVWTGGHISGRKIGTIVDFCVTIVPLAHDY